MQTKHPCLPYATGCFGLTCDVQALQPQVPGFNSHVGDKGYMSSQAKFICPVYKVKEEVLHYKSFSHGNQTRDLDKPCTLCSGPKSTLKLRGPQVLLSVS